MKSKLNVVLSGNVIPTLVLMGIAILIPFLLINVSIAISPILIILMVGICCVAVIVNDFRFGVYATLIGSSIVFFLQRISPVAFPFGTLPDLLIILSFLVLLINTKKENLSFKGFFSHPITIGYIVFKMYHLFQIFNPNAISLNAFFFSLRNFTIALLFVVLYAFFRSPRRIMDFVSIWLVIAVLAAIYGLKQEFIGLFDFEWDEIARLPPEQFGLIFVWGHLRKFSFLSDPPAFGVFMAISALASFMLAMGPIARSKKIFWAVAGLIMLWSMGYSGTRTAYAMVIVGFVLFGMLAIKKRSTMYLMAGVILGFGVIMFGPFHNGTVIRIRSAFKPSEDASMEVRDVKRVKFQPYVRSHPIGGGLLTTSSPCFRFSPGHELCGNWDPDSGYLQTGLEQGWIGLVIEMGFYFIIMLVGINNFYVLKRPQNVMLNLIFLLPFFAMTIAQFTQNSMPYKPSYIIITATFAALIKVREFEI